MNTAHMKGVLFNTARGAIRQANINGQELGGFEVPVPSIVLQECFEACCRDIDGLSAQKTLASEKAQATFDALLDQVFRVG